MRKVLTNKNQKEHRVFEANTRLVTLGDVDPDGEIPVEDGGFRTDTPTCPQLAFHILCSRTVRRRRRIGTLDCKTAFLTGKQHDRDIYVRPPNIGLPGVPPGSLLQCVKRCILFTGSASSMIFKSNSSTARSRFGRTANRKGLL